MSSGMFSGRYGWSWNLESSEKSKNNFEMIFIMKITRGEEKRGSKGRGRVLQNTRYYLFFFFFRIFRKQLSFHFREIGNSIFTINEIIYSSSGNPFLFFSNDEKKLGFSFILNEKYFELF